MSYDDPDPKQTAVNARAWRIKRAKTPPTESRDLVCVRDALHIAAIMLRTDLSVTFTREELIAEAHRLTELDLKLYDEDMIAVITREGKRAFEGLL